MTRARPDILPPELSGAGEYDPIPPPIPSFACYLLSSDPELPSWIPEDEREGLASLTRGHDDGDLEDALIVKTGDQVEVYRDAGEPEDNLFRRDWSWVEGAISRAYEQGRLDTRQQLSIALNAFGTAAERAAQVAEEHAGDLAAAKAEGAREERGRLASELHAAMEERAQERDALIRERDKLAALVAELRAQLTTAQSDLEADRQLLARCNPPGYLVEPGPRVGEHAWIWDSCDDEWDGFGGADDEETAREHAWRHFRLVAAERESGER
jgi:hypothetical protein